MSMRPIGPNMGRKEEQPTSGPSCPERASRASRKWIAPIVLLLLLSGTADLLSRSGHPLVFSFTDVAFLAALAVLTGIYVVLARTGDPARSGLGEARPGQEDAGAAQSVTAPNSKVWGASSRAGDQ